MVRVARKLWIFEDCFFELPGNETNPVHRQSPLLWICPIRGLHVFVGKPECRSAEINPSHRRIFCGD